MFTHRTRSTGQDPFRNLSGQAVTRTIGGMATHCEYAYLFFQVPKHIIICAGTCAVPRFHKEERPKLVANDETADDAEWDRLYTKAEEFVKSGTTQFEESIRHNLVLNKLRESYEGRPFQQLPLAADKQEHQNFVHWSSAHTIFDLENRPRHDNDNQRFNLFPGSLITYLVRNSDNNRIECAHVQDVVGNSEYEIRGKIFILATGAVQTPQVSLEVSRTMWVC